MPFHTINTSRIDTSMIKHYVSSFGHSHAESLHILLHDYSYTNKTQRSLKHNHWVLCVGFKWVKMYFDYGLKVPNILLIFQDDLKKIFWRFFMVFLWTLLVFTLIFRPLYLFSQLAIACKSFSHNKTPKQKFYCNP